MQQISIAIRNFNDRVKQMNQTNSRQLVLSADDARNLHSDVYALLNNVTELLLQLNTDTTEENTSVSLDGGGFK